MFGRRYITEKRRAVHGGDRTADRSRNVVIARRNIRHQRSQHIERSSHADTLLYLHIRRHLVQRNVSGALHHDLHIVVPCPFCQLSQTDQLLDLAHICGICQAPRAAGVPQRNGHIIFFTDLQYLVKIFIKRIFPACHAHPGKHQASSPADDIHLPFVLPDLLNGLSCNSAVKRHKIHTVFRMKPYHIYKIFCRQCGQISLIMNHAVIDRNGPDHNRAFSGQLLPERLRVAVTGQIHDGLCPQPDGAHHFLHLHIVIFTVSGYAKIHIYFGPQHAPYAFRVQTGVASVGADYRFSLCHQFHKPFNRHLLLCRHCLHLPGSDSFSGCIHLCGITVHLILLSSWCLCFSVFFVNGVPAAVRFLYGSSARGKYICMIHGTCPLSQIKLCRQHMRQIVFCPDYRLFQAISPGKIRRNGTG